MSPVTPDNMQPVMIRPGWLMATLAKYLHGIDSNGNYYFQLSSTGTGLDIWTPGFKNAVQRLDKELASKNAKYENAWLTDFLLTSLADLKDKLYRLHSATRKGAWVEWDSQKLRGTYYDILARTLMLMSLEDENKNNLEGALDDE